MNPNYLVISARAMHHCEYCGAPEAVFNFRFEVEHVVPISAGGSNHATNLCLSCRSCNLFKSYLESFADPETGDVFPLFNPRTDIRSDHFRFEAKSGLIVGLTGIGRATVACLKMNSDSQQFARQQ